MLLASLTRTLANRGEYTPVEQHHDDGGDVERTHGRDNEEVRVVERTFALHAFVRVVYPQRYGRGECYGYDPGYYYGDVYPARILMLGILYGFCHCYVSVQRTYTSDRNIRASVIGQKSLCAIAIGWERLLRNAQPHPPVNADGSQIDNGSRAAKHVKCYPHVAYHVA